MKGWVYVITNPSISGTKVGFSTKDPELRARELSSTGVPYPYVVEYDVLVEHPKKYEQAIHRRLKDEGQGEAKEWFKCTPEEAVVAIKTVIGDDKIIIESYRRVERAKAEELQRQQLQEKELREKQEEELRRASKAEQERAEHLQYLRRKEEAEEAELRKIKAQEKQEISRTGNGTPFQEELEKTRKEEKIRREEEEKKIARQYLERKEASLQGGNEKRKDGTQSTNNVPGTIEVLFAIFSLPFWAYGVYVSTSVGAILTFLFICLVCVFVIYIALTNASKNSNEKK